MKYILIAIVALLVISCSAQTRQDERIEKFESFLGKEKADMLTQKVEFFEACLKYRYKNIPIEKAYEAYLNEIEEKGVMHIDWEKDWKIDKVKLDSLNEAIKASGLYQEIWLKKDSVWVENGTLKYRYVYKDEDGSIVSSIEGEAIIPGMGSNDNYDKWIKEEKEVIEFNRFGKYYQGLDLIKDYDTALIKHLAATDAGGYLMPSGVAGGLLYNKADFSDYFIKRIIVVEAFW